MLVILLASVGAMHHGKMAVASETPSHQIVASAPAMAACDSGECHKPHHAPESGMSDACAIVCLGTPAPWIAGAQTAPVQIGRSLKRHFTALTYEGRLVGPGYRPPKSI
ncbi:hypothetical protein EYE42_11930 [Paracoccus subflavus]|uniref:DUF2946 domain-containing protein n=1 Tax=Paracoccus subflavus TaxID=2528244 RepID=A0A4Q9FYZ0_9RHOB|nr:hypothetical protein [Paracoccus subflavus]TBN38610.1 hypothetical protein EYE42_11930 [Paracoccus subflavus]